MTEDDLYPVAQTPSRPEPLPGANCIILDVESGQVVIIGNFNLFKLDAEDRALVGALSDAVRKHLEAKPPKPVSDWPFPFPRRSKDDPFMKIVREQTPGNEGPTSEQPEAKQDA
jgi:hypothetical protein